MSSKSIQDKEVDLFNKLLMDLNNLLFQSQEWLFKYPVIKEMVLNNYLMCNESENLNQLRSNLETSMKTLNFDHVMQPKILKIFKVPYLEIIKLNLQYLYIPQEIDIVFEKLEEFRRENANITDQIMDAIGSC